MNKLHEIINNFDPITLDKTDNVKLLNRIDIKFAFNKRLLPDILNDVIEHYYLLEFQGIRQNTYNNIYLDTPKFQFYLQHHNGQLNRKKIRIRRYANSGAVFFEIKSKINKGNTIKERIPKTNFSEKLGRKSSEFLYNKTHLFPENLLPSVNIDFSRITLVDKNMQERITFDTELHFSSSLNQYSFSNLVIAEIKQSRKNHSELIPVLKKYNIREVSISKYCLGINSLIEGIKHNRFKSRIKTINKINNENI